MDKFLFRQSPSLDDESYVLKPYNRGLGVRPTRKTTHAALRRHSALHHNEDFRAAAFIYSGCAAAAAESTDPLYSRLHRLTTVHQRVREILSGECPSEVSNETDPTSVSTAREAKALKVAAIGSVSVRPQNQRVYKVVFEEKSRPPARQPCASFDGIVEGASFDQAPQQRVVPRRSNSIVSGFLKKHHEPSSRWRQYSGVDSHRLYPRNRKHNYSHDFLASLNRL